MKHHFRNFLILVSALVVNSASAETLSGAQYTYTFTPPAGIAPPYFVTQSLSSGQVVFNISAGGVFDEETPAVKWGPFLDDSAVELSFELVGATTAIAAPTATDSDSSANIAAAPSSEPVDPFLVWTQERLSARSALDKTLDANLEGDPFPNFAEYLLGFDPLQRETIDDALLIVPNGEGGYDIEFSRLQDTNGYQAIIERLDLTTGATTLLTATETRPGGVTDIVTEVFKESGAPFFVRVQFVPFESLPEEAE
ncbi:hypothetical protein [Cerasicoccus frondis]|uniref:hypothetical protein n=1 Tax=Cerasicoccus frondis TaxID=490090 RepID=UPI002852BE41|nr:hypothetical protein [Cerasicoccus frondis]